MKRGKVYPLKTTGEHVRFITIETTFGYARVTHSSGEMTHVLPNEIDDRESVEREDFPPDNKDES